MIPKILKTYSVPGVSFPTHYSADEAAAEDADNLWMLIQAVAGDRSKAGALMANVVYLNGEARSKKEAFEAAYPGMKLLSTTRQRG